MLNKKAIIILIILLFIGFLVVIKGRFGDKHITVLASQPKTEKIVFGLVKWPGYLGLYAARQLGFFDQEGLLIDWRDYDSLQELSEDYINGEINGRANLVSDAINETYKGVDHKIVFILDYSTGGDAIITNDKKITSIKDLENKRVAYEPNSLEEFLLMFLLWGSGLDSSSVRPIFAKAEESARLLVDGKVDAAVTYEPYISELLNDEKYSKMFSTADDRNLIIDVATFKSDFIKQNPTIILAFSKAYFKGVDFIKNHPEEAKEMLAGLFSISKDDAGRQLKDVYIPDLKENRIAFTFAAGSQSIYSNLRRIGRFFEDYYKKDNILDTDVLVDSKFVVNLFKIIYETAD